jgi:hypothetical protein
MFNLSTQEVVSSIEKTPLVNFHGIIFQEYGDFFGKNVKLPNVGNKSFKKLDSQEKFRRVRLDYQDNFMKMLKIFFMNKSVTQALSKKFNTKLKFDSVDIWIDNKGYGLPPHTDNKSIKLSLQIYLGNDNIGTSLFSTEAVLKTFEYKFNCGYALLNNSKSLHGTQTVVNKNGRISLYARYS